MRRQGGARAFLRSTAAIAVGLLIAVQPVPGVAASSAAAPQQHCTGVVQRDCFVQLSTGIRLHVVEVGPAHGQPLLLLPGFTDTALSWEATAQRLHLLDPLLRIIMPDLRGHGQSSMPSASSCAHDPAACFTIVDLADDVLALMDADGIRQAPIGGHSTGTAVATEIALDHPGRVSKLLLVSTAADASSPTIQAGAAFVEQGWAGAFTAAGYPWPDAAYLLTPDVAVPDYAAWVQGAWDYDTMAPPALLNQVVSDTEQVKVGTWLGGITNIAAIDNTTRLRAMRTPTLVIWASQDGVFSAGDEDRLIGALLAASAVGGSFWWKEYGVLPPNADGSQTDFAHNLPWEAPGALALDMLSFLVVGRPTDVLFHSDYPTDVRRVIAEPGKAVLIHGG